MDVERNPTMFGGNRFKLAVFGFNCASGRAATTVPERWTVGAPSVRGPWPT